MRLEGTHGRLLGGALSAVFAEHIWPMDHVYFALLYILLRIRRSKEVIALLAVLLFGDRLLEPAEMDCLIAASSSATGYVVTLISLRLSAVACHALLKWRYLHIAITVATGFNVIITRFLPSRVSLRLLEMQGRWLIWFVNLAFKGWLYLSSKAPDSDYGDVHLTGPRQIRLLRLQRRIPFREIEPSSWQPT